MHQPVGHQLLIQQCPGSSSRAFAKPTQHRSEKYLLPLTLVAGLTFTTTMGTSRLSTDFTCSSTTRSVAALAGPHCQRNSLCDAAGSRLWRKRHFRKRSRRQRSHLTPKTSKRHLVNVSWDVRIPRKTALRFVCSAEREQGRVAALVRGATPPQMTSVAKPCWPGACGACYHCGFGPQVEAASHTWGKWLLR